MGGELGQPVQLPCSIRCRTNTTTCGPRWRAGGGERSSLAAIDDRLLPVLVFPQSPAGRTALDGARDWPARGKRRAAGVARSSAARGRHSSPRAKVQRSHISRRAFHCGGSRATRLYIGVTLTEWGYAPIAGARMRERRSCAKRRSPHSNRVMSFGPPLPNLFAVVRSMVSVISKRPRCGCNRALTSGEALPMSTNVGQALDHLALVALRRGDTQRAAPLLSESLEIWRNVGRLECLAYCLGGVATLASATGQPAAARLWGAVAGLRQVAGLTSGRNSPGRGAAKHRGDARG